MPQPRAGRAWERSNGRAGGSRLLQGPRRFPGYHSPGRSLQGDPDPPPHTIVGVRGGGEKPSGKEGVRLKLGMGLGLVAAEARRKGGLGS